MKVLRTACVSESMYELLLLERSVDLTNVGMRSPEQAVVGLLQTWNNVLADASAAGTRGGGLASAPRRGAGLSAYAPPVESSCICTFVSPPLDCTEVCFSGRPMVGELWGR